ncbi:helix-turn-helix domain-containing protein [Granulicella mallensis]|uniref:Helix-turn-helix domain-containing protein n=1 Tax=Granulicella mallensis (strain ATCC BAA-1857 / DSM 23137 / MP5ACTX8) TaxID=682795 RepID=G8NQF3_GRAMM|nr:helix-turn-helix domain-containing protein [Granulicella mallensis]AEU36102.1 hypothetical protein AciX8_1764 [Granulicella mallensis MP5ACTX8]
MMTLVDAIASSKKAPRIKDLVELFDCSDTKLYELVRDDRIPHFRVGSSIRFDPFVLSRWVQGKAA